MFLETICIDRGRVLNEAAHIDRMQRTAIHFGFQISTLPALASMLPPTLRYIKVKCRILYRESVQDITFEKYQPKRIQSLKLVEATPRYGYKYADREELTRLLTRKGEADEILVTCKGLITDTTFSNVVFRQGEHYFTPDSWLLNGTKRQKLLREGRIIEKRITCETLHEYDSVSLINAMLDIEDTIPVPVSSIFH